MLTTLCSIEPLLGVGLSDPPIEDLEGKKLCFTFDTNEEGNLVVGVIYMTQEEIDAAPVIPSDLE